MFSVRLACVKRAASVRPEPGSNSLWKLYIQTLRVFISILAITIRSQLPLWFFRLFWLLKIPNLFGISRAFSLVVHCSIFKILVSGFRAATFTLYHIQKLLSSKHFVNCCSFLFSRTFPSRRDQLFYFITSCPVCQVNILWTKVQAVHFFLLEQAAQNSQPLYSITLSLSCQVNFSWTIFASHCQSPDSCSGFLCSFVPLTFALVRQLLYYITFICLCQGNIF